MHADIENIRKWTDLERVSGCRNAFLAQNTWVSRWIRVRNLHVADKKRPEGKGRKGKCQMLKNGKNKEEEKQVEEEQQQQQQQKTTPKTTPKRKNPRTATRRKRS